MKKIREGELAVAKARQMAAQNGFAFEANSPEELKQGLMLMKRQLRDMEAHRDQYELALRNGFVIAGFGGNLQGIDVPETLMTGKVPAGMTPEQALNEVIDFMRETIKKATKDLLASSASPKSSVKYIETKKKRNPVRESIDWMEWWKRKNLPPEVHQLHYWKMTYQERSQDHWDAEEWDISKEEDIKEHFVTLVLKYRAHKIKNEIEEMFEVAEKLYKSFTDTEFFIKEFDIDYSEKYKDICKKATQLGSVEYLESIKDDWAHIEKDYFKGCFDLTYDEFVSETFPEIKELLSKGKAEISEARKSKGLKEGHLDHIKAKWQSELNKGVEPKTLMDPWAVCEGMKWLGKDGWIRVEEVLIPTEYEEPYPDFYMEIFDQRTCRISHDIYTINEINSYVRETKARLVNNGTKNLAERVLDFDTYDKYYDEGAEAYFEGKSLSEVPITGNAWFREAWEEGWKNAKACDEEDYGADYEDEYWEDYDPIQESANLREDADSERKEMQALFKKAARKVKVKILDTYVKSKRHWSVTLDTEDEYDADNFRDAMNDLLGENSGTYSYDDMEGLGNVHIGVFEYYEYSEDDYRDLDPSIRDKYVVYCEPAELYKRRREMDW